MIRRARPSDGSRLHRLQSLLPRQSPDLLDYGLAVGDVRVSTIDGQVVGYVLPVPGDGVHLAELVVDAAYRREGHATALLDAVCDALDDGDEVTLAVAPDNEGAQALYRATGFEQTERRPDYFNGEPALWFVKTM